MESEEYFSDSTKENNVETDGATTGATGSLEVNKSHSVGLPVSTSMEDRPKRKTKPPKRYDDEWDPTTERLKRKFQRKKNSLSRLVNTANDMMKSRGSRRTLKGLIDKLERALKDFEETADEYACYVDKEDLIHLMDYVEIITDWANYCLDNIETHLTERKNEAESVCSSVQSFDSVSTSHSHVSKSSKHPAYAQRKEHRSLGEQIGYGDRRIRELEKEVQLLRQGIIDGQPSLQDPELLANRLLDFQDDDSPRDEHHHDDGNDETPLERHQRDEHHHDDRKDETPSKRHPRDEHQHDDGNDETPLERHRGDEHQHNDENDDSSLKREVQVAFLHNATETYKPQVRDELNEDIAEIKESTPVHKASVTSSVADAIQKSNAERIRLESCTPVTFSHDSVRTCELETPKTRRTENTPLSSDYTRQSVPQESQSEERLNVSWVQRFCDGQDSPRFVNNENNSVFTKSLPRLQLPRFAGDPLEWPSFISLFKCLVHDQPLTDTQRMTHLQRALDGDAKKVICGMLNHGHMYKTALTELEEHFGNEEAVARAYLRTIFDHPRVTEDNFMTLRSFYNTLHVAVSTLNNLSYVNDLAATDNVRRAVNKLPETLKQRWGERKVEMMPKKATLVEFDEWLRARVRAKASVAEHPMSSATSRTPSRIDNRRRNAPSNRHNSSVAQSSRASTLATSVSKGDSNSTLGTAEPAKSTASTNSLCQSQSKEIKSPNDKNCVVCQRRHPIDKCERFKAMDVNERAKFAKEKTLCFFCLDSTEHIARYCGRKTRCDVGDCNKRHHPLIHGAAPVFTGTSSINYGDATTLLQMVPVTVKTPRGVTTNTYAFLDSGSQTTLVLENFADKIGLEGERTVLHLSTVNSPERATPSRKVSFMVSDTSNISDIPVEEAWTVPKLNLPQQRVTKDTIKNCPHLAGIKIPAVDSKDVTILLGVNVIEAVLQREVRRGPPGQPVAILTAFGWTLTGSIKPFINPEGLHVMHVHRVLNPEEALLKQVEEWWRTDSFGTKYERETPRSREDKKALETLEKTVKSIDDRYEVGMLWREDDVEFPDNRKMAEKRLRSTERRLERDDVLAEKYCSIIDGYVSKGYARKLSPEEVSHPTRNQWFLPHHPVLNPNKPGKVRIVMDAAAKCDGISLNDKLLIGPDLLNNLVGVLLRFREYRVGISADIEAIYVPSVSCHRRRLTRP